MSILSHGRRQFLRGTGGFVLAVPLLPSLLPRTAQAQAQGPALPRFIAFGTEHGCIGEDSMFPELSVLTEQENLYSDHVIRQGSLRLGSDGSNSSLSKVLAASSGTLTSALAQKLNVLRGLDVAFTMTHHQGGHLGNFADNEGSSSGDKATQPDKRPTIDQVMAWSPSFYASDLGSIRKRSLQIGLGGDKAMSWQYEDTDTRSGNVVPLPTSQSSLELFNAIFVPPSGPGEENKRKAVVDRVLENYKRLTSGAFGDARRISAADKKRLDQHMTRIAELQRSVSAVASCGALATPDDERWGQQVGIDVGAMVRFYQVFNDVIVAGITCGTTRIASIHAAETFSAYAGDWHQEIAHQNQKPESQKELVAAGQTFFEGVFLDLVSKLDIEEGDTGKTYLDNSLVMWSQESGALTHEPISLPIVTAGSAAGYFSTGNYVDYRNRTSRELNTPRLPGILYNQYLANVLEAMGVPASEFEHNGEKGYGLHYRNSEYAGPKGDSGDRAWPDRIFNDASKPLPFLVG
jgi:hypothetical protein